MRKLLGITPALLVLSLTANAADIDDLIKKMKDSDVSVRRHAAKALAEAGPESRPALAALIKGLKDPDLYVRRFSAQAIGNIGPDAKAAQSALKAVLADTREKKDVQEAAAAALGKLGTGGVDALIAVIKDPNKEPEVRRKALDAIGQMGPNARAAVPALVEALKGGGGGKKKAANPDDIRMDAAAALGQVASAKDEEALAALSSLAGQKGKNNALKSAANNAIRKIKARK